MKQKPARAPANVSRASNPRSSWPYVSGAAAPSSHAHAAPRALVRVAVRVVVARAKGGRVARALVRVAVRVVVARVKGGHFPGASSREARKGWTGIF